MNSVEHQREHTRHDYREFVIEELADSEAALRARVRSLESDVASYQALAREGIHVLHAVVVERDRLRQENRRLREVIRDELRVAA